MNTTVNATVDLYFQFYQLPDGNWAWEARLPKTIYRVADYRPCPEGEGQAYTYICSVGKQIGIGSLGEKIVEVFLGERLPDLSEAFETAFRWDEKHKKWQSQRQAGGITYIFVPASSDVGTMPPPIDLTNATPRWCVQAHRLLHRSADGTFRICAVMMLKEIISPRAERRRARKLAARCAAA